MTPIDLRKLAEDENFRALYEDQKSPVAEQIAALQAEVNDERTVGQVLEMKRAKLAGMRLVRDIVIRAHEAQLNAERTALEEIEAKRNRSRSSLPWLSSFKAFRPVPGNPLGRVARRG